VREHIKEYEHLFAIAMSHPNWPESYTNWQTCFEEHFIRAMQTGYINPLLNLKLDIQAQLQAEKSWKGMVFVNDMYDEIRAHKEQAQGSLQDVVHIILGRLDKKYQSDKVVKDVARELRRDSDYLESIRDYVARMRLDTSQKSSEWRRRTPAQIIKSEYVNGCTDVALVFIALARELGIPATYVETFEKSTQDPNFDKSRGHIFVDVSIRRKWIRYDPTNGPTLEGKNIVDGREYVEFGKGLDFFEVYPLKRGVYHGNPINMQNLDNLNLNR
jgi:hypothetical protein